MMSPSRSWFWMGTAVGALLPIVASLPANAVVFGQTEVDQAQFVAIAVPRAASYYNLLVLEQRSNKRPCWRESGSNPTRIDPLLLNFNFTGICGRSTDSNGYSIRAAGKDLGMSYRLSVQKQQKDVVLLGIPNRTQNAGVIELGRTRGLRSGFLKIHLNPGWRFAKRTYGGKALGHIYFSRDTAPPTGSLASGTGTAPPKRPKPITPAPPPKPILSRRPPDLPRSGATAYQVMVLTPSPTQQDKVRAQQPGAFRTSYQGQSVMQVGTFGDRRRAESLKTALTRQGFKVLVVPKRTVVSRLESSSSPQDGTLPRIAVPTPTAPLGNARGAKGVYQTRPSTTAQRRLPPPPPSAGSEPQYRVMVVAQTSDQQMKVKSLVPGAFRTSYQGQRVLQVGAYRQPQEAEPVVDLLKRNGMSVITTSL